MIKLEQVSKIYTNEGASAIGIQNVNCEFKLGEFVAITGESGSGKSTLLNVVSLMDSYEEGELSIDGKSTVEFSKAEFANYRANYVSFIFQEYNLVDSFTVLENIMLPLLARGKSKFEAKAIALRAIKQVGLERVYRHKATKLSGGEKQRTVIARALVSNAPVIACDEPTGNLDSETAKQIIQLLVDVAKDKLILFVTHDYGSIKDIATRHITMKDGHIENDVPLKRSENNVAIEQIKKPKTRFSRVLGLGIRDVTSTPKKTILAFLVALLVSFSTVATLLGAFYLVRESSSNIVDRTVSYVDANYDDNRVAVYGRGKSDIKIDDASIKLPEGVFVDYGNLLTWQTVSSDGNNMSSKVVINMGNLSDGNSFAGVGYGMIKDEYQSISVPGSKKPTAANEFALGISRRKLDTYSSYDSFKKAIGDNYRISSYDTKTYVNMKLTGVFVLENRHEGNDFYALFCDKSMQTMYDELYRVFSSDSESLNIDSLIHPYLAESTYSIADYPLNFRESIYTTTHDRTRVYANTKYSGFDLTIHYRGAKTIIPTEEIIYENKVDEFEIYPSSYMRYVAEAKSVASIYCPNNNATALVAKTFRDAGFMTYLASDPRYVDNSINKDHGYVNLLLTIAYCAAFIAASVLISFIGSLIIGVIYNDRKKDYAIFSSLSFSRNALRGINAVEMMFYFLITSLMSYLTVFFSTFFVRLYALNALASPSIKSKDIVFYESLLKPINSLYQSATNPIFIIIYFVFMIVLAFLISTWIMNKFMKKTLTTNMRKGGELL